MRISPPLLQPARLLLVTLLMAAKGFGQTYQFSTPISGGMDLNVSDFGIFLPGQNQISGSSFGGAYLSFGALTETVIYDPVNLTLRQVGNITLNNSAVTTTLNETRLVNGQQITATATVQQQIVGGVIAFDSGIVPANSDNPDYLYYSHFNSTIQVSGSYLLDTGGQIYTGDFSPSLIFNGSLGIGLPYYNVSFNGDSGSISLSGRGGETGNVSSSPDFNGGPTLWGVTAANGFDLSLYSGAGADPFHQFSLQAPASIIATLVPEPSSLALLGVGILSLIRFRKMKRYLIV